MVQGEGLTGGHVQAVAGGCNAPLDTYAGTPSSSTTGSTTQLGNTCSDSVAFSVPCTDGWVAVGMNGWGDASSDYLAQVSFICAEIVVGPQAGSQVTTASPAESLELSPAGSAMPFTPLTQVGPAPGAW